MNIGQLNLFYKNNKLIFDSLIKVLLLILMTYESIQTFMVDCLVYFYLAYETMHITTAINKIPIDHKEGEMISIQFQKWMIFSFLSIFQSFTNIFLIFPGKFLVTYLCNAIKIILIILLINGYHQFLTSFNDITESLYKEFTEKLDTGYNYMKHSLLYEPADKPSNGDEFNSHGVINKMYQSFSTWFYPNKHTS